MNARTLLLSTLALTALTALSCQKAEEPQKETHTFDSEEVTVNKPSAAAKDYTVNITASEKVEWSAELDQTYDWITLGSDSGKGNGTVSYSLTENDGLSSRTAKILVDARTKAGDFSASKVINVVQIGSEPSLLISPSGEQEVSAEGVSSYVVEVTSNLSSWTASLEFKNGDGWARIASGSTGSNDGRITVVIDKNPNTEFRTVELTVSNAEYPALTSKVTIKQQYADMKYILTIAGMTGYIPAGTYTMTVSPSSGTASTAEVTVSEKDGNTVIEYSTLLAAGEYKLTKLSAGESTYNLNAPFILGENGAMSSMAAWNSSIEKFGGNEKWPIEIGSFADLSALKTAVADGEAFAGKYFAQTCDITMSADSWDGIGSETTPFSGKYDGKGYMVTGLSINVSDATGHALFNYLKGTGAEQKASIKNLTIKGKGTAEADIVAEDSYIAALVARMDSFTEVVSCVNYANVKCAGGQANGSKKAAGLVGNAEGELILIENCENRGKLTATNSSYNLNDCGGLLGNAKGTSDKNRITVRGCRNYGECLFDGNAGGLIGNLDECTDVFRCANYGDVTNTKRSMRVGGLIGSIAVSSAITVSECFNLGSLDGLVNNGGLVGYAEGDFVISNCYNRGAITLTGNNANNSGLVGHKKTASGTITNCYCAADYKPKGTGNNAGAIVGMNDNNNISGVTGCYYEESRGFAKGAGSNTDAVGVVEAKDSDWFKSGTAISGWDSSVWKFEAGKYPTLLNNPED